VRDGPAKGAVFSGGAGVSGSPNVGIATHLHSAWVSFLAKLVESIFLIHRKIANSRSTPTTSSRTQAFTTGSNRLFQCRQWVTAFLQDGLSGNTHQRLPFVFKPARTRPIQRLVARFPVRR